MRGLLQHWTKSSIIPSSKGESVWRNKKAQKEDRFLRGRQIAYLIYDQFRVTGTHDSVENYTDLFTVALRNDDIQEFDSKWDGILLSMTKIPHDDILEGLYKLRIRESEKLKTVLELYHLETQKKLGPDYHRLKTMVKRSIEQEIRNKNFGARSGNFEKNAVVKNQGTKQRVQRILGNCWQWETNGQCVNGDNCSFRHDMNKRGKSSPPNPSPTSFMRQNERKPSRTRSPRGKSASGRMSRWPCKDYLRGTCNNSFCENGTLQNACSTRPRVVVGLEKSAHSHTVRLMNSRRKGLKRIMTKVLWLCWKREIGKKENPSQMFVTIERGNLWKEVIRNWDEIHLNVCFLLHDNWVAYFRTWSRRSLFSGRAPTCRDQSSVWSSQRLLHVIPKFETKILRSVTFVQVNFMSVAPTLQNLRIVHKKETEWQEQGAREAAWKLAKRVFKLKQHPRATFFSSPENRCLLASTLKHEEREFVVDSRASMHMISKKDLSNAEMDTLTKSCSPLIVITANGEVQSHEEAIVYVYILDNESPREHASSIIARKADQWSRTSSH